METQVGKRETPMAGRLRQAASGGPAGQQFFEKLLEIRASFMHDHSLVSLFQEYFYYGKKCVPNTIKEKR